MTGNGELVARVDDAATTEAIDAQEILERNAMALSDVSGSVAPAYRIDGCALRRHGTGND